MKDPCIRKLLKETKLMHFFNDGDSKVVDELTLPVAKARIDIAVINGHLHGFEIKSASDTLQRLPSQIEAYTKVFDYVSIVTEAKYSDKISSMVPSYVGILICLEKSGCQSIKIIRKPKINRAKEKFYVAKLLWREELIEVLNENNIKFRKSDRNWLLCEVLSNNLDLKTISSTVREKLKKRHDWKSQL